ncbi:MAG: hypothetical protein K5640_04695, partial [Treponema sp.]|nr:hypothetical protein [Treponema sp.]
DVQQIIRKDSLVFIREISTRRPQKEFIWGLYFYDMNTNLIPDKKYKPQYLVDFSYDTQTFSIKENKEYYILNSL